MDESKNDSSAHLAHVSLVVHSLQLETDFYRSVLDLPLGRKVDMGNHVIQYFESGTSALLELIEYRDGHTLHNSEEQEFLHHMAFAVSDINETVAKIEPSTGRVINTPSFIKQLGFFSAMVQDPEGFRIELIQFV